MESCGSQYHTIYNQKITHIHTLTLNSNALQSVKGRPRFRLNVQEMTLICNCFQF